MDTLATLQDILVQEFCISRDQLTPAAQLSNLGIDSLDVLQLLFKVEDTYGIAIKDDTPGDLATIGEVVIYIDGLLARPADATAGGEPPPRQPAHPSS